MVRPINDAGPNKVVVVDNWFAELKENSRK